MAYILQELHLTTRDRPSLLCHLSGISVRKSRFKNFINSLKSNFSLLGFGMAQDIKGKCFCVAKPRAVLDLQQVIQIFQSRHAAVQLTGASSLSVARCFGVSEKTVRDIWTGRTWHNETAHLDPSRPARTLAPPGRPVGRKDSVPRRKSNQQRRADSPKDRFLCASKTAESGLPAQSDPDDPFHDDWPFWEQTNSVRGVNPKPDLQPGQQVLSFSTSASSLNQQIVTSGSKAISKSGRRDPVAKMEPLTTSSKVVAKEPAPRACLPPNDYGCWPRIRSGGDGNSEPEPLPSSARRDSHQAGRSGAVYTAADDERGASPFARTSAAPPPSPPPFP